MILERSLATIADDRGAANDLAARTRSGSARTPDGLVRVNVTVNGRTVSAVVDTRMTLLDFLRNVLGLTGTKQGCDRGEYGACTMLADGRRNNSCLTLAVMRSGGEITTIEGAAERVPGRRRLYRATGVVLEECYLSIADSTSMRDAEALTASALPQVRNAATVPGKHLQRTRCWYLRDSGSPCNKRKPGIRCPAREGNNGWRAIFGGRSDCIAVNPSDLAAALVTLGAEVNLDSNTGTRAVRVADFYCDSKQRPDRETVPRHGEFIRRIRIPRCDVSPRTAYVKVRDRPSFQFALVSAGVAVTLDVSATVTSAHITLGGIASRPWKSSTAAGRLMGRRIAEGSIRDASTAAATGARPYPHNEFKVELVRRTVAAAIANAARHATGRRVRSLPITQARLI